jgi:hypothetical protein
VAVVRDRFAIDSGLIRAHSWRAMVGEAEIGGEQLPEARSGRYRRPIPAQK